MLRCSKTNPGASRARREEESRLYYALKVRTIYFRLIVLKVISISPSIAARGRGRGGGPPQGGSGNKGPPGSKGPWQGGKLICDTTKLDVLSFIILGAGGSGRGRGGI